MGMDHWLGSNILVQEMVVKVRIRTNNSLSCTRIYLPQALSFDSPLLKNITDACAK